MGGCLLVVHLTASVEEITVFEIHRASGGFYWRLKSTNGEVLCHSEVYTTKQAAQYGIDAVKRIAPTAPVVDKT